MGLVNSDEDKTFGVTFRCVVEQALDCVLVMSVAMASA